MPFAPRGSHLTAEPHSGQDAGSYSGCLPGNVEATILSCRLPTLEDGSLCAGVLCCPRIFGTVVWWVVGGSRPAALALFICSIYVLNKPNKLVVKKSLKNAVENSNVLSNKKPKFLFLWRIQFHIFSAKPYFLILHCLKLVSNFLNDASFLTWIE